ncbi:hypothetical protein MBLNU230_g0726t1 [Neophaeotheca triangularis]
MYQRPVTPQLTPEEAEESLNARPPTPPPVPEKSSARPVPTKSPSESIVTAQQRKRKWSIFSVSYRSPMTDSLLDSRLSNEKDRDVSPSPAITISKAPDTATSGERRRKSSIMPFFHLPPYFARDRGERASDSPSPSPSPSPSLSPLAIFEERGERIQAQQRPRANRMSSSDPVSPLSHPANAIFQSRPRLIRFTSRDRLSPPIEPLPFTAPVATLPPVAESQQSLPLQPPSTPRKDSKASTISQKHATSAPTSPEKQRPKRHSSILSHLFSQSTTNNTTPQTPTQPHAALTPSAAEDSPTPHFFNRRFALPNVRSSSSSPTPLLRRLSRSPPRQPPVDPLEVSNFYQTPYSQRYNDTRRTEMAAVRARMEAELNEDNGDTEQDADEDEDNGDGDRNSNADSVANEAGEGMARKSRGKGRRGGGFELDVPDHLPNSPLCPLDTRRKSGGKAICPMHGRGKKGEGVGGKFGGRGVVTMGSVARGRGGGEGTRERVRGRVATAGNGNDIGNGRRQPEIVFDSTLERVGTDGRDW